MKIRGILATLLLLAAGLQTADAQVMKIWRNGKFDSYDISIVDSVQYVETAYEWVDLGLPSGTLWATCNVGANSPEEYGDYFAWGETEQKDEYTWETYWFFGGYNDDPEHLQEHIIDKYNYSDGLKELLPRDDAATVNWGENCQMPSREQMEELIDGNNTTYEWTTLNGVNGRKITSKSNGNYIFLPTAGFYSETTLVNAGSAGYYWSRSFGPYLLDAYMLNLYDWQSGKLVLSDAERQDGLSVRPVQVLKTPYNWPVLSINLNETELTLLVGEALQLTATVLPTYAKNKNVTWQSSDEAVATVDQTGKVTAKADGACVLTCSATDGSGVKAECQVTVASDLHEYVDLGLPSGTLWATCNLGANSPEESGDYYAWGETQTKDAYTALTYSYGGASDGLGPFSKYNDEDGMTELLPEDDAATANWGSQWQMPSREQCVELINEAYTTAVKTTLNHKKGYLITSKINGNSIFLPMAGWYFEDIEDEGTFGFCSSRTLHAGEPSNVYGILLMNSIRMSENLRSAGSTIRPVRVEKKTREHEYVDLGLPSGTLWATCNLGANSPEEYGDYFAWGETEPKKSDGTWGDYSWGTYKWMNRGEADWTQISKYTFADSQTEACWYNSNGTFIGDGQTVLFPEDDAATANWGSEWQMPSMDQMFELFDSENTTSTWTTVNGVNGRLVTSIRNGSTIFLPAAGRLNDIEFAGTNGYYWSHVLNDLYSDHACILYFNEDKFSVSRFDRCSGLSVRPVRVEKGVHVQEITLNEEDVLIYN